MRLEPWRHCSCIIAEGTKSDIQHTKSQQPQLPPMRAPTPPPSGTITRRDHTRGSVIAHFFFTRPHMRGFQFFFLVHVFATGTGIYFTKGMHLIVFMVVIPDITQKQTSLEFYLNKVSYRLYCLHPPPTQPITLAHPRINLHRQRVINSFDISSHSYSFTVIHKKRGDTSWNQVSPFGVHAPR